MKGHGYGMNDKKGLRIGELTARIPLVQGGMGVGISVRPAKGIVFHGWKSHSVRV